MSCTRSGGKPDKPWQVRSAGYSTWHYRSRWAMRRDVREIIWDSAAEIWHWEDGAWRLYERIEPETRADQ